MSAHDDKALSAGLELRGRGDLEAAETRLAAAVAADPGSGAARTALASVLIAGGRHAEAVPHVEAALAVDPANGAALHCLGLLFLDRALLQQASDAFERCVTIEPGRIDAWRNLAWTQRAIGRPLEARATVERALRLAPDEPGLLASLAALCEFSGEHERVLEILAPRIAQGQHSVEELLTLTTSLQALERSTEARGLLERAVDGAPEPERYRVHFALAALLDRAGDYDAAFAHARQANAGKHARFDAVAYRRNVEGIMRGFRELRANGPLAAGADSQRPVFIIGMPRSGTSLIEQILAAHPDVAGGGELGHVPVLAQTTSIAAPRPGGTQRLSVDDAERLAAVCLRELARIDANTARVTDKLWENFEYLGFIEQLFPHARIIHCRRNPPDVAVSCYFHHFAGASGAAFAYDLADIGAFYRQYARLMDFWRGASGLTMLELDYESVVRDLEGQARRVVGFLGLEWSPGCLDFHATGRTVNTASYAQVRRPIYGTAVGRWQHYERHLAGFFAAAALSERNRFRGPGRGR